ncbi:MAG: ECF transporter S component [Lachnospiraceae bacterium]|nr:ECF transporter S component [Lachnospiraceae bacterium]
MKYYFLASFIIGLASFLPFFKILKTRESQLKKIVVLAVLVAVSVAGRYALSMFPNVKPMAAIAIISGIAFDAESGFFVGAFSMFTSNILFGQGPWTPWQMFAMGLVGFFSGILFSKKKLKSAPKKLRVSLFCIYGFFSVLLLYGGIMNPASLLMSSYEINKENLIAIYLSGLPMDLVHAGSTVVFLAAGADPLLKKLERLKKKW